ncbi:hypothetical protein VTN00DRAFT_5091 [Thermoascus crustaceus]|uniref:uncharacterized protein n=1 Tax=Thermoascus crustaceus TaxID=5088 RepID=UPI003742EB58
MDDSPLQPKISKSCDDCKARKKRGVECHFSYTKRRLRRSEPNRSPLPKQDDAFVSSVAPPQSAIGSHGGLQQPTGCPPKLYMEHILENRHAHEQYVASSSLAFFSESRIRSVSNLLGHTKLRDLIETLATVIHARMNRGGRPSGSTIKFKRPSSPVQITEESASSYIRAYFEQVHPIHPFLDRKEFEEKAFSPQLPRLLSSSPPFSALYHTVLALGCQYQEGGTFDPGKGKAWELFQIALGLFSDILVPRETLVNVQAVTAMAVFALNFSCIQIEEMLISEAARMAQSLGDSADISKVLIDYDIGSPIPETPEAVFGDYDWFLSSARFARLLSKAYEMLFSVSATMNSVDLYYAAIDTVSDDLERWRSSIPKEFRPGEPFRPQHFMNPCSMQVALRTHYFYYNAVISFSRLTLHVGAERPGERQAESKKKLMNAARLIIELTRYIDPEAYTPIWILGVMPLTALFILFDLVVHNPTHRETRSNLALLDVVAGYFSRLEYATGGSIPSSLLSDFAHIARQFVREVQSRNPSADILCSPCTNPNPLDRPPMMHQNVDIPSTSNAGCGIPNPDGINRETPITENLFYPTSNLQAEAAIGDEIPAGFDIMNIFGSIIPDFIDPLGQTDLLNEREMQDAIP